MNNEKLRTVYANINTARELLKDIDTIYLDEIDYSLSALIHASIDILFVARYYALLDMKKDFNKESE